MYSIDLIERLGRERLKKRANFVAPGKEYIHMC
jgi:hypothetical protein